MDYLHKKNFDFVSHILPANTFGVVRFRGTEGFSTCYRFEIDLVSNNADLDLTEVLKNPGTFTILREDGDIPFNGILAQFEQLHEMDEHVFYRAVLVPKLWWLSLTHHNQVLLNKTVPDIIKEVLKDGGLTSLDFELKLQKTYPKWDYICQYRESHLNFVSRWMEREGIYYYFEQTKNGEKVIITDTKIAHTEMPEGKTMYYSPASGLDEMHREEVVKTFACRQKMLPKTLNIKDYNYMTPSLEISGSADVSKDGRGNVYLYGNHFRNAKEGNALAKIRAEELLCQEKRFYGESTIPYLRPGYLFDLEDHYRKDFNQKYLTVDLEHEGSQTAYLLSGIQKGLSEVEKHPYYRNSFVGIPVGVQYRHESNTEKARFYGTMNAKVDAAGSGQCAELDEYGRYKVIMPFDLSGNKNGKASAWLRMAQPYTGAGHGMHFPLHKGTEVMLSFIDGDPDRPLISSSVPNPEHPSVVTASKPYSANITTSGGNKITFVDTNGQQQVLIESPCKESILKLGDRHGGKASIFDGASSLLNYELTGIKLGLALAGAIIPSSGMDGRVDKGIQLQTSSGLKINAVKKEESVGPGYSSTSVKGANLMSVKGYNSESVMGYSKSSVIGKRSQLIVGSNDVTVMGFKEYLVMKKNSIVGAATKVKATATKLAGKVTKLFGNKTQVGGEDVEMREMTTEMSGERTQMDGEATELSGETTELSGETTTLSGETTTLSGETTELSGESSEITGMKMII